MRCSLDVARLVRGEGSQPSVRRCGHGSDLHVKIIASGWMEARKILDAYLEPRTALSDDVFAVESLQMLPDRSTDLNLFRIRPLVDTIWKLRRGAGAARFFDARLHDTPSAGLAVSRRGSREAVDAWIPVDEVRCVIEFFGWPR